MLLLSKLLCRILPVTWTQPLLNENGTAGTSELAVSSTGNNNPTWYAFHTSSGRDGNYYIGGYRDQSAWDIYVYITTLKSINVTGYSMYFSGLNSSSKWMNGYTTLSYSDNNNDWVQLAYNNADYYIEGSGATHSNTFENLGYHKYYRICIHNHGNSYSDAMYISSIRLTAKYEDFV